MKSRGRPYKSTIDFNRLCIVSSDILLTNPEICSTMKEFCQKAGYSLKSRYMLKDRVQQQFGDDHDIIPMLVICRTKKGKKDV